MTYNFSPSVATSEACLVLAQGQIGQSAAFSSQPCDWTERAIRRLIDLCRLQLGWDGHGGRPANLDTILFAASIITSLARPKMPCPSIMPLSYGGVQIEWHRNNWDLEIEIPFPNSMIVYAHDLTTGKDETYDLTISLEKVSHLIEKITS